MKAWLQSEMFLSNSVEMMKNLSRLSRSLRNGEIIPRNSHQNSSNNNDGGAICHEEMSAADCYEKRIAFIQKQHEKMLAALHREVEQLKRKNKGFMT